MPIVPHAVLNDLVFRVFHATGIPEADAHIVADHPFFRYARRIVSQAPNVGGIAESDKTEGRLPSFLHCDVERSRNRYDTICPFCVDNPQG